VIRTRSRIETDDKFKWALEDLVGSDEICQVGFRKIKKSLLDIKKFKGQLNNLEKLEQALELFLELSQKFEKFLVYSNMRLHQDTQNRYYQALSGEADILKVEFNAAISFIEPELLSLEESYLRNLSEKNVKYKHYIDNLIRLKGHVLSPEIEKILANAGDYASSYDNIFSMLNNADIKFDPVIDYKDNNIKHKLTHGNFLTFLENHDREIREQAYNNYYNPFLSRKYAITAIFSSSIKSDVFFSRTRKFNSSLSSELFSFNLPDNIYKDLIKKVNNRLDILHRYLEFRREKLGLEKLKAFDLYVPIFKKIKLEIGYEEAKSIVIEALKPLGDDYAVKLSDAFNKSWIDVYENKNKRSGAYSWGAYGCHPFVLLNYNNKLNDVFTLAHELGHAMHSSYSWSNQDYLYSHYTIFLAEIASTVNEILLINYFLDKYKNDNDMTDYLKNHFCEEFRRTIYRQTMFAEFELKIHELAEEGEPLTFEYINKIYRKLNKKYHGEAVEFDDKSDFEWARVPHFYNSFYVYQYATGFSIAYGFAERILSGDKDFYLEFLKSGSKDYTHEIIKKTGFDLSNPDFIDKTLDKYNDLVIELKK
jgi:oligoendopeptidase F